MSANELAMGYMLAVKCVIMFAAGIIVGALVLHEMYTSRVITYFIKNGDTFKDAYKKLISIIGLYYKNYFRERLET